MGEALSLVMGLGIGAFFGVIAYGGYQIARLFKISSDMDEVYCVFETTAVKALAKKKGYDLDKEILKGKVFKTIPKGLRSRIKQQIIKDMFGEEKKKE